MFMVRLGSGDLVFRLDLDPAEGETIIASWPVARPPGAYERFDPDAEAYVPRDPVEVEAMLLAQIDAERERLYDALFAVSDNRRDEYIEKTIEAYSETGPWLYLQRLADRKGTTIDDERLAVLIARDVANEARSAIAEAAVAGKAAVRAATTLEGKVAAYDAIPWPVQGADA